MTLRGVRYTVEPAPTKKSKGCTLYTDRVIANGKFVGTVIQRVCHGKTTVTTCTRKKLCRKGTDLMWLLDQAGMRAGERRRRS